MASSRLIGAIFVEKGLVTQEQLERALQIQDDTNERLGEILVREFGVPRLDLASVLAEQWGAFERAGRAEEVDAPAAPDAGASDAGYGTREPASAIEPVADGGRSTPDVHESSGELRAAITELEQRLATAIGSMPSAEELARLDALAAAVDTLRARVDELEARPAVDDRLGSRIDELEHRLADVVQHLADTHAVVDSVRAEAGARLDQSVQALRAELAALRSQLEQLHEAVDDGVDWRRQVEGRIERVQEDLRRLGAEHAAVRELVSSQEQQVQGEIGSLGMRVDELLSLRHGDVRATGEANEALEARIDELHALRAAELDEARARSGDSGAHPDDPAHSTSLASETERALRSELDRLASMLEEKDAAGIDDREALRTELERLVLSVGWRLERVEETLASSVDWRLERLEQTLASEESESLRTAVASLEHRLDVQALQSEEQVRVTERSLRKGLASLGKRLVASQAAYEEEGNALRRSIERLGAPVKADERIAERDNEGRREQRFAGATTFVAFVPTADGYRIVELAGSPPAVGETVQVPGSDAPLRVTRLGPSFPLDGRPCAYLERG